jgi:hypothetical protein
MREDDQEQAEPEERQASVLSAREAMSLISSDADRDESQEPEAERES